MSRLPFSATRMNDTDIDPKRGVDLRLSHPVREIERCMDDIIFNAVDIIQEAARDNDLRCFYFNLMSDRGYRNREFEELIMVIADLIDIGVSQGKFRDERDAVIAVTEDVIGAHVGYLCDVYPELFDYVDRRNTNNIDRAITVYSRYLDAIDIYRRNGNSVSKSRDRDRDRGRDSGRVNYGSERDRDRDRGRSNSRRDSWNREGIRGSRRGSPSSRENRFGNSDQSSRFDDVDPTNNDSREERRSRDRDEDDYNDRPRNERTLQRMPRGQENHIPSDAHGDIDDALARDGRTTSSSEGNEAMEQVENKNPLMRAFEMTDAWVPSVAYPHPPVFSLDKDLYFEMNLQDGVVVPVLQPKDSAVDYYAHESIAFGATPKDFKRFNDQTQVAERIAAMHDSLVNPQIAVTVGDDQVTLHRHVQLSENHGYSYTLKDMFAKLSYERVRLEMEQRSKSKDVRVDMVSSLGNIVETVVCTVEEAGYLEEVRQQTSLTKLCEKIRQIAKLVRPEIFLQLDRHLAREVNRMMRQYLSIPSVRITSFTGDWLELFSHITAEFGEGYRDAINTYQARFIEQLFRFDENAESFAFHKLSAGSELSADVRPFIMAHEVKLVYIDEVSYNLNIDMLPDVASQLMTEDTPYFHDLAQNVLTKDAGGANRFFIQTADLRTFEVSRSWMNESAVLLRLVS